MNLAHDPVFGTAGTIEYAFITLFSTKTPQKNFLYCDNIPHLDGTVPKSGFKSITVSEHVYRKFFDVYEKSKKDLEMKGITSFSGYLTSMMEEMMQKHEVFAKYAPMMEKLAVDDNRVVVKDNKKNRIAEVQIKNGELYCMLDEKTDCIHVGFVYSLPEVYRTLYEHGVKMPNIK